MNDRIIRLIGEDNYKKIVNKTVLVVGLGGVGGICVEALVRSGINNIIVIDKDIFDSTNLNRQILATTQNIGESKVDECIKRMKLINNDLNIIGINTYLTKENISILDKYDINYIIDACDTVKTKVELIKYALEHNIKTISSMGTGKRLNPLNLQISTLNKTYNDPLAKAVRKECKDNNLSLNIPVVFSSETPLDNDAIISSMIFVPSTCGLLLSNYVIDDILKEE